MQSLFEPIVKSPSSFLFHIVVNRVFFLEGRGDQSAISKPTQKKKKKNTSVSGAKATLTASDVAMPASQTVLSFNFQVEFQRSESKVRISPP